MLNIRNLVTILLCGCLIGACGDDKKKSDDKAPKPAAGEAKGQGAATPVAASKKSAKPIGNRVASLLSQGKAKKGGMMGGIGLGDLAGKMGGLGAAGIAGAKGAPGASVPAGTPAAVPAKAPAKKPATKKAAAGAKGCKAAVDHVFDLVINEMIGQNSGLPPEAMAMLKGEVEKEKASVVADCEKNWPAKAQQCLLDAGALADIMQCEAMMGGAEMATEAVPSGDAECDKIGVHIAEVYKKSLPGDQTAVYEQVKYTLQNEIAGECAAEPWSKEVRACMLKATGEDQMDACALAGLGNLDLEGLDGE